MKRTSKYIREIYLLSFVLLILTGFVLRPWGVRLDFESPVIAQTVAGSAVEGTVFAVTAGNNLISFNQFSPSALIKPATAITGLQASETILGIDFRPRTGQLFAVTNQSRIYTINTSTAVATVVGAAPFTPAVNGTRFGVDFNPLPDRIRFVSDADQDLRLNPNDGTVAGTDMALAFAAGDPNVAANPNVVASAYTNNFSGATVTTLYGIDSTLDVLVTQGSPGGAPTSPNTGQLFTVGGLTINTTDQVGFDIVSPSGLALAALNPMGSATSSLYSINLMTGAATLIGPIGVAEIVTGIAAVVRVETIFALTTNNGLVSFSAGAPGMASAVTAITGLAAGETLLGIDFRPANGLLYAVGNLSNVYTINTTTGAATLISAVPFTPGVMGVNFGVDFNPVPDRIRFVSDADQDLRLNPNNGAVAGVDGALAFAAGDPNAAANPNVVGSAYTNNFAGTTVTTLYGIDSTLDMLVTQGSPGAAPVSPNTGQLFTVGSLGMGVDVGDELGFDIAPTTNAAFASLLVGGASMLATVNLTTGAVTMIGAIGGGQTIRGIAIDPRIELIFAATNSNKLISFVSTAPGVIQSTSQITGLQDETIIGLDFRPATGVLFAIGSSSRIYTINPLTGGATQVGTGITSPQLNGIAYGFDFNPVPDRIRVTSTATHNLRFNPDTGVSGVGPGLPDGALAYAAGDSGAGQAAFINASAYDNNFAGTTSTTLYGIDTTRDMLVRQGSPGGAPVSPNGGQLFTVGPLGVDSSENTGFDIANGTNNAYAALTVGGMSQFYTINLGTGAATLVGSVGGGEVIRGITVMNNTTPSALPTTMAVVNAASFFSDAIAPNSLAAVFGRFQTAGGGLTLAPGLPLPTLLGGVQVTVNGQNAQLLMTSNGQINMLTPPNIPNGPVSVMITSSDGSVRGGRVIMASTATGIFSMRSTGTGTAAALFTAGGGPLQSVMNPNGSEVPIPAGSASNPTFLVLYATGLRNAPAANVTVMIKNVNVTPTFAGPAPGFVGLEQVNVPIPAALAGSGSVPITITVAGTGKASNVVTVRIL